MIHLKIMVSLLLAFISIPYASAQSAHSIDTAKLSQYLQAIHQVKGFSGEILVAKNNEILFQKVTGLASVENEVSLKNGAKYKIASITKTFTGTLIAIARQEGKLNYSDKAIQYLPGLSPKFKDITIEQLVTHKSGMPHNESIQDYWLKKSKLPMTTLEVMDEINTLDLLFEPGTQMHYSSLGYYLLATILENIYQKAYLEILEEKILKPLEMNTTGTVNTLKIMPGMTSGYHLVTADSLVVAPYRNYSMLKGAGDLYSTSTDLLKWNISFLSGQLLSEETRASLLDPQMMGDTGSVRYDHGWYISDATPQKLYHGGGTWGYSTYNAFYPETGISIIILCNVSTLPMTAIGANVEKIVFGKSFRVPPIYTAITTGSDSLERYTGKFVSNESGMILNITRSGSHLMAQLGGNPPFEIYPKGGHRFFGRKVEVTFTFNVVDGQPTALTADRNGQQFHFNKADR